MKILSLAALALLVFPSLAVGQAAPAVLSPNTALYARVVRLAHSKAANGEIIASVTAIPPGGSEIDLYASRNGERFEKVGEIQDPAFAFGLCCGTLFELPRSVGKLAEGTLLWSGSVSDRSKIEGMQLKIFSSADHGRTWTYLSDCAHSAAPRSSIGGLWEPEFAIAADGALVCFYSDETQAGHSQILRQVRSYDGLHWQDPTPTVASSLQADRPGMPVVTRLPSGTYFMTYELCGTHACGVYFRTSPDGWRWGDATDLGTKIVAEDGSTLAHAPTNVWLPAKPKAGSLVVIGQMTLARDASVSGRNGHTLFISRSGDPAGPWSVIDSPIAVPGARDNYCPNYSSPLLPSPDGQSLLEFASDYSGKTCIMSYAQGPIGASRN